MRGSTTSATSAVHMRHDLCAVFGVNRGAVRLTPTPDSRRKYEAQRFHMPAVWRALQLAS